MMPCFTYLNGESGAGLPSALQLARHGFQGTGARTLLACLLLALCSYGQAPALTVTDHFSGITGRPSNLAFGAQNKIWFTEFDIHRIGWLDPTTRAVKEYPLGAAGAGVNTIVLGPDGAMWFTES